MVGGRFAFRQRAEQLPNRTEQGFGQAGLRFRQKVQRSICLGAHLSSPFRRSDVLDAGYGMWHTKLQRNVKLCAAAMRAMHGEEKFATRYFVSENSSPPAARPSKASVEVRVSEI